MSVESIVAAFANGPKTGAFRHLGHTEVLQGIRNRLANPDKIDQGDANLCGPASFLYCVLKDYPETWVTYVTQMWLKGSARIHGLEVKPSQRCLNANPSGLKAVDWVALASLRDSENAFLDCGSSSDSISGRTMPGALASWFERAGYKNVVNDTNLFFTKGAVSLQTAVGLARQNRRVCLMINARMIQGKDGISGVFSTPDHWVVLQGGDGITGDQANLKIWTWGSSVTHGFRRVERVLTNHYGYISAMAA
jgi:hypothetical protein